MEAPDAWIVRLAAMGFLADMRAHRAEILGEAHMILVADLLVAEEHDHVLGERALELGEFEVGQRPREIDIADLRADLWAAARDRDGLVPLASIKPVHVRSSRQRRRTRDFIDTKS